MGVRFECPAGHKLNVKAELAGQRGICPQCGARFIVPTASGGRAPNSSGPPPSNVDGFSALAAAEAIPSPSAPPAFSADPLADDVEWFVRTAAGQQFGPATSETMVAWLAEGRVPEDGWAWRTGWADWRPARDARIHVAAASPTRPPLPPHASPPPAAAFGSDEFDAEVEWPTVQSHPGEADPRSFDVSEAPTTFRPHRKRSNAVVLAALGLLAVGVLAAMIFVLNRDPTPPAPVESSGDASTSASR